MFLLYILFITNNIYLLSHQNKILSERLQIILAQFRATAVQSLSYVRPHGVAE